MKSITIAGGIGKDATTRTAGDQKVTGFSVGVSEGFGQNKRTVWFDCSLWGTRGEKLAEHLTKGTRVCVSGDLSTREHDGKTYLTVRVAEVTLMGGGDRDNRPEAPRNDGYGAGGRPSGGNMPDDDFDSIPFAPCVL